jgi:protein-S-isoprenylcysteine O-methyltransferase Ste14
LTADWLGRPPIPPAAFVAAKVSLGIPPGALAMRVGGFGPRAAGTWAEAAGVVLLALGALVVAAAFAGLGGSVRLGLPAEETRLRTRGIYRFSRNPMYLGAFAACAGVSLLVPNPVVLASTVLTVMLHHRIVLAEERFLERRFGAEWSDYRARVRRYL